MKFRLLLFCFTLLGFIAIPAFAVDGDEFNPNYILSDEELQDSKSMTRSDVQAFLEDQGGYIAKLKTEDKDGTKRTVSDIIYRVAQEYYINPKYLLVKLQKEQSLVTDKDPTQKQLDGATGYGITDGCGWSCDTYKRNKGFGKQVDAAAGIMRWYYDNVDEQSFIKKPHTNYTISGETVRPANYATAFLYTYTPHRLGNENFWKLWQEWFEQVYPDGSLLKTANDSTVYLIQHGEKRAIESMSALVTRFDPKFIITVPSAELSRYDVGPPISLPNYAILKRGSKYYLLDYDTVRPFKNKATFQEFGYHPDEVIDITEDDLEAYTVGTTITTDEVNPLGRLIRAKETNGLYFLKETLYHPIYDESIPPLALQGVFEEEGSLDDLKGFDEGDPILFPNGTLLGIKGFNKIYVIENGKKRHIANEKVFEGLGYKWENILWSNAFMSIAHKTGQPVYLEREIVVAEEPEEEPEPAVVETPVEDPVDEEEESVMYRADVTKTIGPVYTTNVDTYLVADYETGQILAGKNVDFERPLASLTKVVTAYNLLEDDLNLKAITTYDPTKHRSLYHRFRIASGEMVRNRDLLDAFLVSSLNTPGRMLVEGHTSESGFIASLNSRADAWGLNNTNFIDVAGVEVENLSTARDYLTAFTNSLENETVKEYLGKSEYEYTEVFDTDNLPDHFDTHSNDLVTTPNLGFTIEASKTGYLDEAGANLAMLVRRPSDGRKFVVITMGNPDYYNRFVVPKALTTWALSEF